MRRKVASGPGSEGDKAGLADPREVQNASEAKEQVRTIFLFVAVFACVIGGAVISSPSRGASKPTNGYAMLREQSDEEVFNNTKRDVARFQRTGELPTFGFSKGKYYTLAGSPCFRNKPCAAKLRGLCGYDAIKATSPPVELLKPGRLSKRSKLSEYAQCFMWYSNKFWTRPTGGNKGVLVPRLGGGIDDKSELVKAMETYEKQNNCKPFQVIPLTLDLNQTDVCHEFFHRNAQWAEHPNSLWFMKATDGSTGRHVFLLQRKDVERITAAGRADCPRNSTVASREVPNLWTIGGRKFDNRVYLLVASMKPLTILFRRGHLRFSLQNYTLDIKPRSLEEFIHFGGESKAERIKQIQAGVPPEEDPELARHVTNPRFGLSFTNDSSEILKPVEMLRGELVKEKGEVEGAAAWEKLQRSVRNAALQAFYSLKDRYADRGYDTRWGFAFIAMDVAYDRDMNAYVLDVNSGPSFYHEHEWPPWFFKERSALIREAMDSVQEVAFHKLAQSPNRTKQGLQTISGGSKGWDVLFEEAAGGVRGEGIIAPGGCVSLQPRDSVGAGVPPSALKRA